MVDAGSPRGHATATKLTVSHAIGLLFSKGTYTSSHLAPCSRGRPSLGLVPPCMLMGLS